MKRTIAAILAISPVMLHAQAKSSAQPVSTPTLQSSLVTPAAINPANHSTTASAVRIASITAPKLIYTADLSPEQIKFAHEYVGDRTIVLHMTVDANGKPTDLHVVKSTNMFIDAGVLAAVSHYRFQPATLDGAPVAAPLTMKYVIE
jgi:TonB family protein